MSYPTTNYIQEKEILSQKLSSLSEEELIDLTRVQKELAIRAKNNPVKYFWPHQRNCDGVHCSSAQITFTTYDGKQHTIRGCPQFEFLAAQQETKAFFGGNRSGKTTAGAIEVVCHTTGEYPDWWQGWKLDRACVGRIFCSDFQKGAKIISKKLHQWFPKDKIISIYRNNQKAEVEWYVRHKSGEVSFFDLMTYEQEVDMAEGWDGDWVWFDEPPPRDMYIATVRGLVDSGGHCWFSLTPLKEPWLFDEIYNSKDKSIFSVICDMRHNLERFNPLSQTMIGLKEEAIRKFEMKLTEEERETRAHGKFRYLAGRIWKEWERSVHTFDRSIWKAKREGVFVDGQPPIHWPRCMLIDPHDRNPHALLWVAVDEVGDYWAYREAWLANTLIEDVCAWIKKVEVESKERVQVRIMDPNFGPKKYGNTGKTVRDEFEESGRNLNYPIRFNFGDDKKELGRKEFARLLKYDPAKPLSLVNHPKFRMASDMKEAIYQIEHYIWDEFRSGIERDPKEKPKDMNTHFPDLFHYLALSNFSWHKPTITEGRGAFYVR